MALQPADSLTPARVTDPISLLALEFGGFPEISALNPRFLPGRERLKVTLDIDLAACSARTTPATLLRDLRRLLPRLENHACGGNDNLLDSLFEAGRLGNRAVGEVEDSVDIAHLLEHLVIDLQHFIARMSICSGITCGHESPRSRYDLFIETPGRAVGRLCVLLARDLINGLLRGEDHILLYPDAARLARHMLDNRGIRMTAGEAAARLAIDVRPAETCLMILMRKRFVREVETTINFSGSRIFEIVDLDPSGKV